MKITKWKFLINRNGRKKKFVHLCGQMTHLFCGSGEKKFPLNISLTGFPLMRGVLHPMRENFPPENRFVMLFLSLSKNQQNVYRRNIIHKFVSYINFAHPQDNDWKIIIMISLLKETPACHPHDKQLSHEDDDFI